MAVPNVFLARGAPGGACAHNGALVHIITFQRTIAIYQVHKYVVCRCSNLMLCSAHFKRHHDKCILPHTHRHSHNKQKRKGQSRPSPLADIPHLQHKSFYVSPLMQHTVPSSTAVLKSRTNPPHASACRHKEPPAYARQTATSQHAYFSTTSSLRPLSHLSQFQVAGWKPRFRTPGTQRLQAPALVLTSL